MSALTLYVPAETRLPDNRDWENRFEIRSETSERVYVVSQHKQKRHWGCSCPGWRTRRSCKHLAAMQLPAGETPCEVKIAGGTNG